MATGNQVALITGANKGIGLETARQLGRQGVTVVLGARDGAKGEAAAQELKSEGIDAHAVALDTTDAASIAALPGFLAQHFGRLDILVNNAGILKDWGTPASQTSLPVLRETLETNLIGTWAVIEALLPMLKASPSGRLVNVTSQLGSITDMGDPTSSFYETTIPAYQVSKAAINALTVLLARELRDTRIKVNSADPGWVKTDMGSDAAFLTVEEGAKTSVQLATLPDDGPTGAFFHLGKPVKW